MNMIQPLPSWNTHPGWGDRQARIMIWSSTCKDTDLYLTVSMQGSLLVPASMSAPRSFMNSGNLSVSKGFQKGHSGWGGFAVSYRSGFPFEMCSTDRLVFFSFPGDHFHSQQGSWFSDLINSVFSCWKW